MDQTVQVAPVPPELSSVLAPDVVAFLESLHTTFEPRRQELLQARSKSTPRFLKETKSIRENPYWHVAAPPQDLQKRWVEITGPTDKKMIINALNSGADVFMADFEDAATPAWQHLLEGQQNLTEAIAGTLKLTTPEGKQYTLNEKRAVLMVRPRGLHLPERHVLINGTPLSGALFDFGVYFFRNTAALLAKGTGPYFYLPKLENHYEARLWNDIFLFAEDALGLPAGTIRATVLIETISAAFEMEEILWELSDHITGLNAGRWDYLFSIIKRFSQDPNCLFPDRSLLTMTTPFMKSYTDLLVHTCHKRHAHAIGGMAAFIPNRRDPEANQRAFSKVIEDKQRELHQGFDGTWVAHPDLVPLAHQEFQAFLKDAPHQKQIEGRVPEDVEAKLLNFALPGSVITEEGVKHNVAVALTYLASWLNGTGAVALFNLMEDAATAEISRAQLWQWGHRPQAVLADGKQITLAWINSILDKECNKHGEDPAFLKARDLLKTLINDDECADFLTSAAYEALEDACTQEKMSKS